MGYKLFDVNGIEILHHDLQDKCQWCHDGEQTEEAFVRLYGAGLGLVINPAKKDNPYAPDLVNVNNGNEADLKFQGTPFFKSFSLYGIDPTYAVVFNLKDSQRYLRHYPEIEIYFWINWQAVRFEMGRTLISVKPLNGVWMTPFRDMYNYLSICNIHSYNQRRFDRKGNAKASHVCDIRDNVFKKLI